MGGGPILYFSLGGAFCAGMLGHLLCYLSLQYVLPLVFSIVCLFESVIGSVMGWAAGVQRVPTAWTFVSGFILLVGALMVTLGDRKYDILPRCTEKMKMKFA